MDKIKICIIGQFPPPIHGLSAALQTIVNSKYMNEHYSFDCIDIKDNKKFIDTLRKIKKSNAKIYYFTISQSIFGNLRDMVILKLILNKKGKIIIHYHGGYYKQLYNKMNILQKGINRALLSKIDIMIALSNGLKRLFNDVLESSKIRVCENYVEDSSIINEDTFIHKVNNIKQKPMIDVLYLSNFIKSKGYMDLLNSVVNLKDENVIFHFAGAFFNEKDKYDFIQFVEQNNIKNKVKYHGIVKGAEKKQLLQVSDIFVLPTYYPNEGQPISIIEAMGNGLTVISTNHAGIPDIIKEGNGFLVNPKSPSEISQCIRALLNDRSKIIEIAKNNRKVTLENFREIHYINRLDKIFKEVL
jgi:glycosyltransferase involved in cell wall biosynthesis